MNSAHRRYEVKREFFRFLVTGGSATAAHYLIFWICISVVGISVTIGSAIGYLFGSVVSYLMNYYYTFDSSRPHGAAVVRFYLMVGIGLFINIGAVHMLVKGLSWNPWLAQIFATGVTLVGNFFFSKLFVFSWRKR